MDIMLIWSIANHIESNIKETIDYKQLENRTGFSYRTLRETFKKATNKSLSKYILERRLAHCAYAMIHGDYKMTDVAYDYGFTSYDSFTRAFRRVYGLNPRDFKKAHIKVGRRRIMMGLYAPIVDISRDSNYLTPYLMEVTTMSKSISNVPSSCLLEGVRQVAYSYEECTPFPAALKSYLNYLGQEMDYGYIMAVSGASFRLRWNTEFYDGGNVDICNIYEDPHEAFKRSFKAVGRDYQIYNREDHTKTTFKDIIVKEINEGRPLLAQGIIGPPEVCIITGYDNGGDTLLGWNVFQENTEFATGVTYHDSGYFITASWWENPCSVTLMTLSEEHTPVADTKEILGNAIDILEKEFLTTEGDNGKKNKMAGGQLAYSYWANWLLEAEHFGDNLLLPQLAERYMCHLDAITMISEGREYASIYMKAIAGDNLAVEPLCYKASQLFHQIHVTAGIIMDELGGYEMSEDRLRDFAIKAKREAIVKHIHHAKHLEAEALKVMKNIYTHL